MIDIEDTIRQLRANAEAIRAMVQSVPEVEAQWKPGSETWSLKEVMTHVYNEERIDFRKHLKEMFNDPAQPWSPLRKEELLSVETCQQALAGFLSEREASIAWLRSLESPDWDFHLPAPWGGVISTGDVLVSWVEHDFLHMRQFNEVLHALNIKNAAPYSVRYAGEW